MPTLGQRPISVADSAASNQDRPSRSAVCKEANVAPQQTVAFRLAGAEFSRKTQVFALRRKDGISMRTGTPVRAGQFLARRESILHAGLSPKQILRQRKAP